VHGCEVGGGHVAIEELELHAAGPRQRAFAEAPVDAARLGAAALVALRLPAGEVALAQRHERAHVHLGRQRVPQRVDVLRGQRGGVSPCPLRQWDPLSHCKPAWYAMTRVRCRRTSAAHCRGRAAIWPVRILKPTDTRLPCLLARRAASKSAFV
jgi:hypothetical protein